MADKSIWQAFKDGMLEARYGQNVEPYRPVAQERITKTPIFIEQQPPGILGSFHAGVEGAVAQRIQNILQYGPPLDADTIRGMLKLIDNWQGMKDYISTDVRGTYFSLPHEAAHAIYAKANLKKSALELLSSVPSDAKEIGSLPVYRDMGAYSGSPEQITDEGLAYSLGQHPYRMEHVTNDENINYINAVKKKLPQDLQLQLMKLNMSEWANRSKKIP